MTASSCWKSAPAFPSSGRLFDSLPQDPLIRQAQTLDKECSELMHPILSAAIIQAQQYPPCTQEISLESRILLPNKASFTSQSLTSSCAFRVTSGHDKGVCISPEGSIYKRRRQDWWKGPGQPVAQVLCVVGLSVCVYNGQKRQQDLQAQCYCGIHALGRTCK